MPTPRGGRFLCGATVVAVVSYAAKPTAGYGRGSRAGASAAAPTGFIHAGLDSANFAAWATAANT
jgi:hypothetical protein